MLCLKKMVEQSNIIIGVAIVVSLIVMFIIYRQRQKYNIYQNAFFAMGIFLATTIYPMIQKIEGGSTKFRQSLLGLSTVSIILITMPAIYFFMTWICEAECNATVFKRLHVNGIVFAILGVVITTLGGIIVAEFESAEGIDELKESSSH